MPPFRGGKMMPSIAERAGTRRLSECDGCAEAEPMRMSREFRRRMGARP